MLNKLIVCVCVVNWVLVWTNVINLVQEGQYGQMLVYGYFTLAQFVQLGVLLLFLYPDAQQHPPSTFSHVHIPAYLGRMLHMHYHHRTCKAFELWRDFYCSGCVLIALGFLMGVLRCTYMSTGSADTVLNDIILFISV